MVKNLVLVLAGFKLSDEQMRYIPFPNLELTVHVMTKTTQMGTVIGGGLIAPIVYLLKHKSSPERFANRCYRYGRNGFIVGLVAGPILTIARCWNLEIDSIYDRCYRIRHNEGQMRVDRWSALGALTAMAGLRFAGVGLAKGALLGYGGGFIFGTAANVSLQIKK